MANFRACEVAEVLEPTQPQALTCLWRLTRLSSTLSATVALASSANTPFAEQIGRKALTMLEVYPGLTVWDLLMRDWGGRDVNQIGRQPPLSPNKAATHFLGQGLELGVPDLSPAHVARGKLVKEGRFEEATALDVVTCGGQCPSTRFDPSTADLCPHCGLHPETALHRYWTCPSLRDLPDDDSGTMRRTDWYKKLVLGSMQHLQCWWGRGILPYPYTARALYPHPRPLLAAQHPRARPCPALAAPVGYSHYMHTSWTVSPEAPEPEPEPAPAPEPEWASPQHPI